MKRPALPILLLAACRVEVGPPAGVPEASEGPVQGEVWVYTSMYQSVIDALEPDLERALPGVDVRFYQAGSEKVAQRYEAEIEAGGSPACLLMTSDPFWYVDLKRRGLLRRHFAPTILHVDRGLVDRDGFWATSRISLMVLAVNERVPPEARPRSFADLAAPALRDRFSVADPLASGTAFTTLAFWLEDGGWERVEALDANGMIAAGGNSSVLTRVETGEREVGAILLENLLAADRKGSPAAPVYPSDGAIVVPGPIALTAGCPNAAAARAVYDYVLSPSGQEAIVAGDMYAALPEMPPPAGAPSLADIAVRPWPEGFADRVAGERVATKERWAARRSDGAP